VIHIVNYFFFRNVAADFTNPAISERSLGIIIVLLSFANFPNSFTYCSATRKLTASFPPSELIASAISLIPPAVASAIF